MLYFHCFPSMPTEIDLYLFLPQPENREFFGKRLSYAPLSRPFTVLFVWDFQAILSPLNFFASLKR